MFLNIYRNTSSKVNSLLSLRYFSLSSRICEENKFVKGELYEEDSAFASGKTSVRILNKEMDGLLYIDSFSEIGFKLNNGVRVMGPCVLFPKSVLHWNVSNAKFINEDSLSLFTVLEPKPDIIVIGIGERENMPNFDNKLIPYLRTKKINVEVLPTDRALSTFNFLNSENRCVAGAFIPPSYLEHLGMEEEFESIAAMYPDKVGYIESYVIEDEEKEDILGNMYAESRKKASKVSSGLLDSYGGTDQNSKTFEDIFKSVEESKAKQKSKDSLSEEPSDETKKS